MSSGSVPLGILQKISEFLADLPEDQLADIAAGRARIAYVPVGSDEPAPATRRPAKKAAATKATSVDAVETIRRLETLSSREEVQEALTPFKTKAALVELAKVLNVPGAAKLTADQLRADIVEATVGRRLDSVAIRGFDGPRP